MNSFYRIFIFLFFLILTNLLFSREIILYPSHTSDGEIQEALILLEPGDILTFSEGVFNFEDGLSLDIDNVIIRGQGSDKTILSFKGQLSGAQGLLVTSNKVTLKDFAIEDANGDALKVIGANGIYMINLRTEWTNGPDSNNGAYGLYPVESNDVLIDGCIAIGASDAGIYVGQSKNIIVRNSKAHLNVAGIEIENSYYADVYDNLASHNTAGILVFDLPDLPQQGGHHVRVFRNQSINNDTDNFAPEGNIVGEVPRGTGMIVQANAHVEIFDNILSGNGTVNLAIVSYSAPTDDEDYYPHPKAVQVHNNQFGEVGFDPDLETGELASIVFKLSNGKMPDIFWDGVLPLSQIVLGQPSAERLVLKDNGDASFLTINPIKYMLPFFDSAETDIESYNGHITPLPKVIIE